MTEGNPTVEEARQWAGEAIEELLRERRLGDEDTFVDLILAAVEPYYLDLIEAVRQEERERAGTVNSFESGWNSAFASMAEYISDQPYAPRAHLDGA